MRSICALLVALAATSAAASDLPVHAARALKAGTIVAGDDLRGPDGAALAPAIADAFLGLEARRAIYAGQRITPDDLRPPTVVRRNDLVTMRFLNGRLDIRAEGRALAEGAVGDRIRVLNLESRIPVTARIAGAAMVEVH